MLLAIEMLKGASKGKFKHNFLRSIAIRLSFWMGTFVSKCMEKPKTPTLISVLTHDIAECEFAPSTMSSAEAVRMEVHLSDVRAVLNVKSLHGSFRILSHHNQTQLVAALMPPPHRTPSENACNQAACVLRLSPNLFTCIKLEVNY